MIPRITLAVMLSVISMLALACARVTGDGDQDAQESSVTPMPVYPTPCELLSGPEKDECITILESSPPPPPAAPAGL